MVIWAWEAAGHFPNRDLAGEAESLGRADKASCVAFSYMMNHPLICFSPERHETDRERERLRESM